MNPDLRGVVRSLRRRPAQAVLLAGTLAIGIAAVAALFTLLERVVLRPLPVEDASSVVIAWGRHATRGFEHFPYRYDVFERVRDDVTSLTGVGATDSWGTAERLIEEAQGFSPVRWSRVLGDVFGTLGVRAIAGRVLGAADDVPGGPPVVVISRQLAVQRWSAPPEAIGQTLRVNGVSHTVVGVLPADFDFPRGAQVWSPLRAQYPDWETNPPIRELDLIARLAPGRTPDQAAAEIERIFETDPGIRPIYGDVVPVVRRFPDVVIGDLGTTIAMLFCGGLLLLAIALVNASHLAVVRAAERANASALRVALGARWPHLLAAAALEGALLGALACFLAVPFTFGILLGLLPLAPAALPRVDAVAPTAITWLATGVLGACATMLLVGVPAWHARRAMRNARPGADPNRVIAQRAAGRHLSIALQAGFALWAVAISALLLRTLHNLNALETGFRADGLYLVQLDHRYAHFALPADLPARFDAIVDEVSRGTGVLGATPVLTPPLAGNGGFDLVPTLDPAHADPDRALPYINLEPVSPRYFDVFGVALVEGRGFVAADRAGAEPVVVVNRETARSLWPGDAAIGKRLKLPFPGYEEVWWTVVGVATDTRYRERIDVRPTLYVPFEQLRIFAPRFLAVRARSADGLLAATRAALADVDPSLRAVGVVSVPDRLDTPLARPRFAFVVLAATAATVLFLAAVGVFAIMATRVQQRRREIGVRMACGARASDVGRLVVSDALRFAALGVVAGAVPAVWTGRLLEAQLFGVEPGDPIVLACAAAVVLLAATAACLGPALRAAHTDPLDALRAD